MANPGTVFVAIRHMPGRAAGTNTTFIDQSGTLVHTFAIFAAIASIVGYPIALIQQRISVGYPLAIIAIVTAVVGGHTAAIAHPVGPAPLTAAISHAIIEWIIIADSTIVCQGIATPHAITVQDPLLAKIQDPGRTHIYPVTPPWLQHTCSAIARVKTEYRYQLTTRCRT